MRGRGERPRDQQSENSVVGGRRRLAAEAGDAKVPFEDSYFPGSHGCHTRPPAILRLSLHCGNHNYTCGCLLIAARPIPLGTLSAILRGSPCPPSSSGSPTQLCPRQERATLSIKAGKTPISSGPTPRRAGDDGSAKFQSPWIGRCLVVMVSILLLIITYVYQRRSARARRIT